jgi:long-chain acyl-CoA synthetase
MARELVRVLDAACLSHAGSVAVAGAGGPITYQQLSSDADAIAAALRAAGASDNEPVIVLVSNDAGDFAALLGVWRAGGVAVPLNRLGPHLGATELVDRTGARFVVDAAPAITSARGVVRLDDARRLAGGRVLALPRTAVVSREMLDDAAFVVFTSGSTGEPKGTIGSHRAWAGKLDAIDSILQFGTGVRMLLVLQVTFAFGIWVSLLTLSRGGTMFVQERHDTDRMLAALQGDGITHVAMVPTMLRALMARSAEPSVRAQIACINGRGTLRQLLAGGESLGRKLNEDVQALFPGIGLYDVYGSTETSTSDFFLMPSDQPRFSGTIGRPSPGVDYRIAGADGNSAPAGQPGELQIRSAFMMSGYLDRPALTAAAFDGDWFRTGDIARTREGGVVELLGRAKELISRGGVKISPLEIEQILARHPDIAEALVAGIPDPLMGERIHALVVMRPGALVDEDALRAWAGKWLEKFRIPDVFHFGTALPLGRTGKADRGRLREIAASGETFGAP